MKSNIILITLLITLLCLSCEEDKDTTRPGVPANFRGNLSSNYSITFEWTAVTDDDLAIYELSETKGKGQDSVIVRIKKANTSFKLTGRDFIKNKYFYQVRAVDLFENRSAYSNILEIGFIDNDKPLLKLAWKDLKSSLIDEAIVQFTKLIKLNTTDKNDAYVGRAWAYLRKANGNKNSSYLVSSKNDFMKSNSTDSYAGRSILGLLTNDFNLAAVSADFIKDRKLKSYTHKFLNHINYRYVLIHGAFAYWMKQNDSKVNDYLDEILPSNSPHNLNRSEQKVKLSSLISTISAPIAENELKSIL